MRTPLAVIAQRRRTLAVLALIAGILAVPVQCHGQAGPHSLFVPSAAAAMAPGHHHHEANRGAMSAANSALEPAEGTTVSPVSPPSLVESPAAAPALLLALPDGKPAVAAADAPMFTAPGWVAMLPGAPP